MDQRVLERLLRIAAFVSVAAWFGLLTYNSNRLDNPVFLTIVLVSFGIMVVATIVIEAYRQKLKFLNDNTNLERLKIEEQILTNAYADLRNANKQTHQFSKAELNQKYSAQNATINRARIQDKQE